VCWSGPLLGAAQRHPKSAFPTERVYGNTSTPELRLITCGACSTAHRANYLDNVVVSARMTAAYRWLQAVRKNR